MRRRNFLRNLGLVGATTVLPGSVALANHPQNHLNDTVLLRGKVHSKGKGLANVAVTDGMNVHHTDAQGRYEFLSNKKSVFVYISIPSGYEFPHGGHIAKFYQKITSNVQQFEADFELVPLAQADENHAFVVWADPQTISKEDIQLLQTQSVSDLKELKAGFYSDTLLHGIGCGDLVWDNFELYPDYKEAIAQTGVTFFNVIGNHDMDLTARSDEQSDITFKENFGPTYYSFNRGKVHYVTLDDVFYIGVKKSYIGYLTETQFQWLEQDLKNVSKDTLIILSVHIPTYTGMGRRNKEKKEDMGGVMVNRERLYELLEGYQVHIMSGHTHFNEVWSKNNITEHVHGTVCGAWWTGPICGDGTPSGYGVYEVKGNQLQWYYKATGLPKEYQLKIYPKGFDQQFPDQICVNIWNWDSNWKTEWFEDGQAKGSLEQRTGLDPWAISLYLGKKLPSKHPFVEPVLTDHLFYISQSAAAKTIKVVATDPFGNHFTEVLSL